MYFVRTLLIFDKLQQNVVNAHSYKREKCAVSEDRFYAKVGVWFAD